MNITNKTALVTGGSEGIGLAIVKQLLQCGAHVFVMSRSHTKQTAAKEHLADYTDRLYCYSGDVTQPDDCANAIQQCIRQFGALDILINNVGIYPLKPFLDISLAEWDHVMDTNLRSTFLLTQLAAKQMVKQGTGGKIINISSLEALQSSMPGLAHYSISKHGLWGLTQASALELAAHDISVNAVAAGPTLTPGVQALAGSNSQALGQMNLTRPEGVAETVMGVVNGSMTGQLLIT
jgi:NAD(P)-dependent dehydrogenase (short-subunit alcohol dehydrogenase family)